MIRSIVTRGGCGREFCPSRIPNDCMQIRDRESPKTTKRIVLVIVGGILTKAGTAVEVESQNGASWSRRPLICWTPPNSEIRHGHDNERIPRLGKAGIKVPCRVFVHPRRSRPPVSIGKLWDTTSSLGC